MEEQSSGKFVHEPASQMEMLGRRYIGYDINPLYCAEAQSRVEATKDGKTACNQEPCHKWHGYTAFGHEVPLRGTKTYPFLTPRSGRFVASAPCSRAIYGMVSEANLFGTLE